MNGGFQLAARVVHQDNEYQIYQVLEISVALARSSAGKRLSSPHRLPWYRFRQHGSAVMAKGLRTAHEVILIPDQSFGFHDALSAAGTIKSAETAKTALGATADLPHSIFSQVKITQVCTSLSTDTTGSQRNASHSVSIDQSSAQILLMRLQMRRPIHPKPLQLLHKLQHQPHILPAIRRILHPQPPHKEVPMLHRRGRYRRDEVHPSHVVLECVEVVIGLYAEFQLLDHAAYVAAWVSLLLGPEDQSCLEVVC